MSNGGGVLSGGECPDTETVKQVHVEIGCYKQNLKIVHYGKVAWL